MPLSWTFLHCGLVRQSARLSPAYDPPRCLGADCPLEKHCRDIGTHGSSSPWGSLKSIPQPFRLRFSPWVSLRTIPQPFLLTFQVLPLALFPACLFPLPPSCFQVALFRGFPITRHYAVGVAPAVCAVLPPPPCAFGLQCDLRLPFPSSANPMRLDSISDRAPMWVGRLAPTVWAVAATSPS